MTKTFCDRCGKEIKEEYGWITHRTLYASIKLLPGKNILSGLNERICTYAQNAKIVIFIGL